MTNEEVNFEQELLNIQSTWDQSQSREEREGIEDGDYKLVVKSMELRKSPKTGDIQVRTVFEMLPAPGEPNFLARTIPPKWDNLSDPDRAGYFKDMLNAMGLEYPEKIVDIIPVLEQAKDRIVWATIRNVFTNNRHYINIYVNSLCEE